MIYRPAIDWNKIYLIGDLVRTYVGNYQGQVVRVEQKEVPIYTVRYITYGLNSLIMEAQMRNYEIFSDEVRYVFPAPIPELKQEEFPKIGD